MDRDVKFYRSLLDQLADGVYFVDSERRITYWNRGAEAITGYFADQVIGRCCKDNILMHVDGEGECLCRERCPLVASMEDGEPREAEVFLHHREGHRVPVRVRVVPLRDDAGRVLGAVETFSDMSARIADLLRIEELEHLAYLDPLTGLANRRYAEAVIDGRFAELDRHAWTFGVILADVDHFKQFNDRHGHDVGDRVLQMVANTMSRSSRTFDLVARWGGEEFVIVAANIHQADLCALAERYRTLVEQSVIVLEDERRLNVTISCGAAISRPDDDPESLLNRADEMLYASKRDGRNQVQLAA